MMPFEQKTDRLERARLLEQLTIEAWPPQVLEALDGWKLRAASGVSRRANSVWAVGPFPESGAGNDWLAQAESFAARNGIDACFYVSETSPAGLDEHLQLAGYALSEPCYLMAGSAKLSLERIAARPAVAQCGEITFSLPRPNHRSENEAWLQQFTELKKVPAEREPIYASIFEAIRADKCFASLRIDGKVAALGTVVSQGNFGYISNLMVSPNYRRRGLAACMMGELTRWAIERGAAELYLQVLQDNVAAVRLYQTLGFDIVARHHYRVLQG
ncbi:GNAT family N-acetyltransferase [Saccharibacillus sacchari]|uniref:GNAT family N-acetyltransferase n=1 Tax=Saccharibacillus sacchari TaxID=456493 RepID=A0ACC6P6D8_9BACL